MILPFLNGILGFKKVPVTWMIFLINFIVLGVSLSPQMISQHKLEDKLKDEYFLTSQGRVYAQFITKNPQFYSPLLKKLARGVLEGDSKKLELLGGLALRNKKFTEEGPKTDFKGDQIAISRWKRSLASISVLKDKHPSYMLGLNSEDLSQKKWFSYIFIHGGFVHFLGNMLFFLIFASMLETLIGGLGVLVIFLTSGAFAAGFYLLISGASAAPLIGASGAVSGLMAFFCFLHWNKPVKFIYWLFLPIKGYFGFVYLPGWVIFAIWMAADLAGYFSTITDFGGVAYTAHLGGEFIGLFIGALVSLLRLKYAGATIPTAKVQMGKPIPFNQLYPFAPVISKDVLRR